MNDSECLTWVNQLEEKYNTPKELKCSYSKTSITIKHLIDHEKIFWAVDSSRYYEPRGDMSTRLFRTDNFADLRAWIEAQLKP